jgi:hypothetical protein
LFIEFGDVNVHLTFDLSCPASGKISSHDTFCPRLVHDYSEVRNMTDRFSIPVTGCLLAAVAVLSLAPATASAAVVAGNRVQNMAPQANAQPNPTVAPVNSKPHGKSYGEWSAEFWKWEFSLPVDHHPLFDTADCSAGQSGHVWFLGGTFVTFQVAQGVIKGVANRTCFVPTGTWLFFPVVNNECSTMPGDQLPGFGTSPDDLRACARFASTHIVPGTLSATLDGVPITALSQYDVTSPLFTFGPLPDNNLFGAPAGATGSSVSDGIHLMLHPLSVGSHSLHFYAELDLTDVIGLKFIQDITYNLNVTP